jgi:hypothetical protein
VNPGGVVAYTPLETALRSTAGAGAQRLLGGKTLSCSLALQEARKSVTPLALLFVVFLFAENVYFNSEREDECEEFDIMNIGY